MISRLLLLLISLLFGICAAMASHYFWTHFQSLEALLNTPPKTILYGVGGIFLQGITYTLSVGPEKTLGPAFVLAISGSWLRIRTLLYYAPAGALAALAVPVVIGYSEMHHFQLPPSSMTQLLLLTGTIGGFVYWLVGGRAVGNRPHKLPKRKRVLSKDIQDINPKS